MHSTILLIFLFSQHEAVSVRIPVPCPPSLSPMRSFFHVLELHQGVEALILCLVPVTLLILLGVFELVADLFLELEVEQEILVLAVLLRDLQPFEDLGLVVHEIRDLNHPLFDIELLLEDLTDHLKLLALLDELLVRAFLLEVLVTAEHLR